MTATPPATSAPTSTATSTTDLAELCQLARAGLDAHRFCEALARTGSVSDLLQRDEPALRALGLPPATARRLVIGRNQPQQLAADLDALQRHAITLLAAHLPGYPPQLLAIADPPAVLFVRGQPDCLLTPQLAIVGSRHPTANGAQTAQDFAAHFAALGLTITSGLALGIDTASHTGALAAGGFTVAVCGTGLDQRYPERNAELAHRITLHGALVSEFPPGTPPYPGNFPQRNRLISGLSLGVLVVEAARRSGSLATARCAGEQGREVFAIPGSIHSSQSQGCHQLLRQGATLVENAEDVLSELPKTVFNQILGSPPTSLPGGTEERSRLDNPAEILLDALGFEPTSVDALIASTGLSSTSVASLLLTLELEGRVASDLSGRYFRCARALF
jgi:DNA processing protein